MTQPITPDLVYKLIGVGDPYLSPDGRRLAFVKSWVDRDAMEPRSQVQMMELAGGEAVPFTQGNRDGGPQFSPDGQTLALLRRDSKDKPQVWLMNAAGGEAWQLTHASAGVTEYVWAPDSGSIAFISDVDPDQPPPDHNPQKDPRVKVARRIRYRVDTIGWRGDAHRHLFVIGAGGGDARQVTDGDWDDAYPVWSPDGTRIAFTSGRRDDRDIWGAFLSEAYVVAAAGGDAQLWSGGLYSVGALAWSPDGNRLVAAASDIMEGNVGFQGWLFVLEPGKSPHRLTDDSIRPVVGGPPLLPLARLKWAGDNRILFMADRHGESFLCSVPAEGGDVQRISGGGIQMATVAFDASAENACVLYASPSSAGDIQWIDIAIGVTRQLTGYNRAYFQEHPPAQLQKSSISRGGLEIECRVWVPPDFDESRKYPMILEIHGGPNAAFYDAFTPIHQVLATAGYIVLAVNPRGSSTYGGDFTMAVLGDWGGQDYLDIMAAVDEMSSRPYVDASRLGIHGYSYGGFMTSWTIGHTGRFKAALVGAPCINLSSMYGTSDIGVGFGERQWGGTRKDNLDVYYAHSPLTYAPNVSTPVLLMHGEADVRCPIEQSEQYFVALKRLGKDVEFVRFPNCSHLFIRMGHPKMREEYLSRMLAWFNQRL